MQPIRQGLPIVALLAALAGCAQPSAGPITASGTVEAPDIAIMAEAGGRVISVTADAGAPVKAGQLLVQLDDALPRAQARQADAAIAAAQAAWELLAHGATDELGFHAVEPGHYVTDLHATVLHLLGLDSRKLEAPGRKRLEIDRGEPIRAILA